MAGGDGSQAPERNLHMKYRENGRNKRWIAGDEWEMHSTSLEAPSESLKGLEKEIQPDHAASRKGRCESEETGDGEEARRRSLKSPAGCAPVRNHSGVRRWRD